MNYDNISSEETKGCAQTRAVGDNVTMKSGYKQYTGNISPRTEGTKTFQSESLSESLEPELESESLPSP